MTRFTPRMARFIAEYQVDANGAQAAIRAGYSPRAAAVTAWNLLQKPAVREAVAAGEQRTFEAIEIEAGRVLAETARIAFADLRPLFNEDGTLKAFAELDGETLAGLSVIDTEERPYHRVLKVRRHDKLQALALLGRHLGLFTRRIEVAGGGEGLAEALAAVRRSLS